MLAPTQPHFPLIPALLGERWSPGIGDPSLVGWLTVVAYFLCAWLCYRAAKSPATQNRRVRLAWWVLAAGTLLLGVNKQLDLQSLFTQVGRDIAKEGGWYKDRRAVQVQFIEGIMFLGAAALAGGAWFMRKHLREFFLAGVGAVFVVSFVLIRASSFHSVDSLLSRGPGSLRMNWVLELGGIAIMCWGARRFPRRARPSRRQ